MKHDTYVERRSRLGNEIICPALWTTEDEGDTWTIALPNRQAVLTMWTVTVEGSGSLEDFQETILAGKFGDANWTGQQWDDIDIGGIASKKTTVHSNQRVEGDYWGIYVLQSGECYHALFLNTLQTIIDLNGGFYEGIIRTFRGISSVK